MGRVLDNNLYISWNMEGKKERSLAKNAAIQLTAGGSAGKRDRMMIYPGSSQGDDCNNNNDIARLYRGDDDAPPGPDQDSVPAPGDEVPGRSGAVHRGQGLRQEDVPPGHADWRQESGNIDLSHFDIALYSPFTVQ